VGASSITPKINSVEGKSYRAREAEEKACPPQVEVMTWRPAQIPALPRERQRAVLRREIVEAQLA